MRIFSKQKSLSYAVQSSVMKLNINNNQVTYASSSTDSLGRLERLRHSGPMLHTQATPGPSHAEGTQVKEELKLAIQNRRASQGLDALQLPIKSENKTSYQLSEEERMKIIRRRERNKIAASRCREKKKQRLEELQREADALEDANNELAQELLSLHAEMSSLANNLRTHKCVLTMEKTSNSKDKETLKNS